jgi:hypothetical protein
VRRPAATFLVVGALATACGAQDQPAKTTSIALPGWRVADDSPGISQLAPDLDGLHVVGRTDRKALVRSGDAIRSAVFTFVKAEEAAEAQKRGAGDDYQRKLEHAFRGDTIGHGPGAAVRLLVSRPTESGSDTVELYLLARGRRLILVELVSGHGFDPALRDRVLRRLSR